MVKIDDVRKYLVEQGVEQEIVNNLDKAALIELAAKYKGLEVSSNELLEAKVDSDSDLDSDSNADSKSETQESGCIVEEVPDYASEEWEDYVMSKFTVDELVNGKYPKLAGLRRLVSLIGEIIESRPVTIDVSYPDGPGTTGRATCQYVVKLAFKFGLKSYELGIMNAQDLPVVTFGAVGGSSNLNTDNFMAKYPEAIAESRAEARALRKALRLNVAAAEEIDKSELARQAKDSGNMIAQDGEAPTFINASQVKGIKNLCDKLKIDVQKFINSGSGKYDSIEKVPYDKAVGMMRELNNYQSTDKDSCKPIPAAIRI